MKMKLSRFLASEQQGHEWEDSEVMVMRAYNAHGERTFKVTAFGDHQEGKVYRDKEAVLKRLGDRDGEAS